MTTTSGSQPPDGVDRGLAVGRLADDLDVRLVREDHPEAGADELLVVDEEDADRHRQAPADGAVGRRSAGGRETRNPPGTGPASKRPPNTATRSRIPIRPRPRPPGDADAAVAGAAPVGDLDLQRGGVVADADLRGRAAGVLERVRQGLLDDPVGRQLDARIERARLALDRRARPADPVARTCSSSSPSRSKPGIGASGSVVVSPAPTISRPRPASPRMPSIRRMSASARRRGRIDRRERRSAPRPAGDRARAAPPPAWMTMTLTWWVTTSCSSRAIRSRSSATARASRSSRSRSSRGRPFLDCADVGPPLARPRPERPDGEHGELALDRRR